MIRLAVAAAAVMVLLGNNGLPRRFWMPSAFAATPKTRVAGNAPGMARAFLTRWNGSPFTRAFVADRARCDLYGMLAATGEPVFTCVVRVLDPRDRKYHCLSTHVSSSLATIDHLWLDRCAGWFKPPAQPGVA